MWPKKIHHFIQLAFFVGCLLSYSAVSAQSVPKGISYQAQLNDEEGNPMRNSSARLRIALTAGPDQSKVYYVENQEVQTDDQGVLQMIIGNEANGQDIMRRVPWSEENIWMNIELLNEDGSSKLINQGSFMAVPYAFHTGSAERLIPQEPSQLRTDQSIIWNASGNFKTQPHVHYLGTADEKALFFKTNNTTRMVIASTGQTIYYAYPNLNGPDTEKANYPIVIQDGRQGIYIEIQESRSQDNNFLTFADPLGIHGTVQGQTAGEYYSSFTYLFPLTVKLFDIGLEVANNIAGFVEAGGQAAAVNGAAPGKFAALVQGAIAVGIKTAQFVSWQVNVALSIGVAYTTGSADYAEWIEKENVADLFQGGEVVGIKNGKVSRNTEDADHIMVISSLPAALGAMPAIEDEYKFEKVAFKGQVRTMVVGEVNLGDYIIPTGNNDGLAIALAPENMKTGDYNRIVGVAWEGATNAPLSMINVAVGINANDLSARMEEIDGKLDMITEYLSGGNAQIIDGKLSMIEDENASIASNAAASFAEATKLNPLVSDEEYDKFFDENAEYYQQVFDMAREYLVDMDIDLEKHPELKKLYDDPVSFYKNMRKDPRMSSAMGYFDQTYLMNNPSKKAGKGE